jgi:transcriptional regulator with XRE-family HTH domain
MGNRLKDLRTERRWTHEEAAQKMGVSKSQYTKLERGERRLTEQYIRQAAQGFGVDPAAIIADDDAVPQSTLGPAFSRPGVSPPFAGFVQAGAFLAVDEYFQQDSYEVPEFVLPHPRYPKVRQYAYQSKGDSMTEVGIEDGMWVVAAEAIGYIDTYGETVSGDMVVVERTRFQGSERELTIKEIRYFRDRYELHPRSKNPAYKPIIVPHNLTVDGDEFEVKIIGVVLTAYKDFTRRPR